MTRSRTLVLASLTLASIAFSASVPASAGPVGASPIVTGIIHTIDLDSRTIRIRQADGASAVLGVPVTASIRRNRAASTLSGLVLGDSFLALRDPRSGGLIYLSALGADVSQNKGKVEEIARLSGDITIGLAIFRTGAETKIVRNGTWVSLNHLTRRDSVVVHARPDSNLAVDLIGQGPAAVETEGAIAAVDPALRTLTLAPENGTTPIVLSLDATAMVAKNGLPTALGDLNPGDPAAVVYDPAARVAFCVDTATAGETRGVKGTVAAVDKTAGTVTITPSDGSEAVTLTVTAATEITVNGVRAALADIAAGMPIWAKYSLQTRAAIKIEAGDREDPEEEYAAVKGAVSAVAAAGITINPESGGAPVTLAVDAATKIRINQWPAALKDVKVGDTIMAVYDPKTLIAIKLMVRNGDVVEVRGRVDAVGASSVSILPNGSDPLVTLKVGASTEILLDGKTATLSQISVGDFAWGVYDKATLVATKLWFRRAPEHKRETVDGVVKAVGASSVTILPKTGGSAVTVTVDSSTDIKIDGHPGALAGISIDDAAWSQYDPATKVADKLWIKTENRKKWASVEGTVTAVGSSSLTVQPKSGASAVTLKVDASTEIKIDGKPGTLAGVPLKSTAEAVYDSATMIAVKVVVKTRKDVEWAEVEGTVSAVGASSLTIQPKSGGAALTLKVDSSTEILIDCKPGTLAGVPLKSAVEACYDGATMIAAKVVVTTGNAVEWAVVEGTVSAVGASSLTIQPKSGGAALTLKVDSSTEIKIDGKVGALAGIKTGNAVEAKYIKATLLAKFILVKTK